MTGGRALSFSDLPDSGFLFLDAGFTKNTFFLFLHYPVSSDQRPATSEKASPRDSEQEKSTTIFKKYELCRSHLMRINPG